MKTKDFKKRFNWIKPNANPGLYTSVVVMAVREANGKRRTRTIDDVTTAHAMVSVKQSAHGHDFRSGGPCERSDQKTTCLSVIWATDSTGLKHVRVDVHAECRRTWGDIDPVIPERIDRNMLEQIGRLHLAVYPKLWSTVAGGWSPYWSKEWNSDRGRSANAFVRKLQEDPDDSVTWRVYADWLEEQNPDDELARHIRFFYR